MKVKCYECEKFSLRAKPGMAKLGFGSCSKLPNYQFQSSEYERNCAWFKKEEQKTIDLRFAFLNRKTEK